MNNLKEKVNTAAGKISDTDFTLKNGTICVFPFVIRNGFQNVSEVGFLPKDAESFWYGFFQKIFTGNETITVTWENSTYLTKLDNEYKFAYNFQLGTYYEGIVVPGSETQSLEIDNVVGNDAFLSMQNSSEVTVLFSRNVNEEKETDFLPTEDDLYKLYLLPQTSSTYKWTYISNVNSYTNPKNSSIILTEVTFTSLKDKLQQSGRAIEQYIQYAGIGEPYIVPYVYDYELEGVQYKGVDYIEYQPSSANYLQVELQGANAISGLEIEGRSLTWTKTGESETGEDIYQWVSTPWKRLLLQDTVANQVNNLNRTSLPSRNFYYFPDETLSFVTSKTFQEDIKTRNDALALNENAGKLSMGSESDWSDLANGLHKSNPLTADGTHYDYNNKNWLPTSWTGTTYTRDTNGNFYCVDNLSIKPTDSFVDIMNKNSFIYETQPIIPLGFTSSKPYHISTIPLIGKIVSKYWGDKTINPHTTQRKPIGIGYFMDCDIAGMLSNIYSSRQNNQVWSPLGALIGDENKASKYLGTSALNTTLCFSLTDRVKEGGTEYNTIYFGQTKKEDGTTYIFDNHTPYYYGRDNQVTIAKNEDDIFVIDSITVYGLQKGNIKLTALNTLSNSIWTTTVQSKANWTGSIRDWATTIMTGGWSEDYCDWSYLEFAWPERPDKISEGELSLNFQSERNIENAEIRTGEKPSYTYKNNFDSNTIKGYRLSTTNKYIGIYIETTSHSDTKSFTYSDLGIEGVESKETFKSNVGSIILDVNGVIQQNGCVSLKTNSEVNIPITSQDTYTGTYIVGQYGEQLDGSTYPVLSKNETQQIKESVAHIAKKNSKERKVEGTGGYSTKMYYTITLTDSGITFNINELSYTNSAGHIQFIGQPKELFGDFILNWSNDLWKVGGIITSTVKVPKAKLVVKPKTLELVNGSTTLNGIAGTAGQDTSAWHLTYGGTIVEGDIYLSEQPSGVTIEDGIVKWDNTLQAGSYKFKVVGSYEDKTISTYVTLIIVSKETVTFRHPNGFGGFEVLQRKVISSTASYQTYIVIYNGSSKLPIESEAYTNMTLTGGEGISWSKSTTVEYPVLTISGSTMGAGTHNLTFKTTISGTEYTQNFTVIIS